VTDNATIDVDGQLLRIARRSGRGGAPPLLLINGLGANLELLEPFAAALNAVETGLSICPGAGEASYGRHH